MTFATIAEVYTVTRFQLEKECIYLMKKREVLEKLVFNRDNSIEGLKNAIKNRDRMLEQRTVEMGSQTEVINQILATVNKENNEYLEEIQRLRAENKELKMSVSID